MINRHSPETCFTNSGKETFVKRILRYHYEKKYIREKQKRELEKELSDLSKDLSEIKKARQKAKLEKAINNVKRM